MDVTEVIGPMGRHQYKTLLITAIRTIPAAFMMFTLNFSLIQINHWCSPADYLRNRTSEEWRSCCVPRTGSGSYSMCEYYGEDLAGTVSNRSVSCNSWEYDQDMPYETVRKEFDLVCDRGWYVSMLYMSFILGNLFAYIPAGQLADKYGRKPVSMFGVFFASIFTLTSAFANSVEFLLASRFFMGFGFGIYQNPFHCLFIEVAGPEYRNWLILAFSGGWAISVMAVSGLAYLLTDWRTLAIIASFPLHLPFLFLIWRFIPESSRWLLTVKRYEEAEKQIVSQAKENGVTILDPMSVMEELKRKVELDEDQQGKFTFLDLIRNKHLLIVTTILYFSFAITTVVYHGFTITIGQLGGSFHLNFFIGGAVEVVALFLFFFLARTTTRRRALLITYILTGISFLLTIPIDDDIFWLRIAVAMLGRLFNATAYNMLYIFASEIFPTGLRAVGVSGCMAAGRVGSLLASFADDFGRIYGRSAPMVTYGVLSLAASFIFLLLPETTHKHLPDTVAETKVLAKLKHQKKKREVTSTVELK